VIPKADRGETSCMENNPASQADYVRNLLDAYCQTPGTTRRVHRADRLLAVQLYQRRIPLAAVQNALVLGAARRLFRNPDAPPLLTIRSLHFFMPVLDEVLTLNVSQDYFRYLKTKIQPFIQNTTTR
jgi:hypothetical protein